MGNSEDCIFFDKDKCIYPKLNILKKCSYCFLSYVKHEQKLSTLKEHVLYTRDRQKYIFQNLLSITAITLSLLALAHNVFSGGRNIVGVLENILIALQKIAAK